MPGNEVGDRDHNFFSQENFPQGQGRFEVVERSWPVLNNNLRAGNQRQGGYPFISNSRNASVLQSDDSAGHGTTSFHGAHGASISQSSLKPGFSGCLFQNQQTSLNGVVQGNRVLPVVQNESNFSGMDSDPNQYDSSKRLSILNSQQGKGSEVQKNLSRILNPEAAVNFDFLGGQEQVNSQHSGALRFLQGQQTNVNDVQLLQQQVMFQQLQDVQRQQLQQQGIWLQSSPSQFHPLEKPGMPLNGIPVNDTSNYSWQHGFGTSDSNQLQRGVSPAMQGSPRELMVSSQHGQGFHVLGTASQHNDHSRYGVPFSVSEERFSQGSQLDNSALQRMPSGAPSVPGNLFAPSEQTHVQNGTLVPKQLGNASHSNVRFNSDILQEVDSLQRNASPQLEGRQTYTGYTETPERNTPSSPAPHNVATLDPTEERILFGGDDNIWGAFGMETTPVTGAFSVSDSTGLPSGFPSLQSGSWSALMQSALAETSSDNQGAQEEWSGLSVQNVETTVQMSQHNALSDDPRQSAWSNSDMHPSSCSTRPFQLSNDGRSAAASAISGARQSDISPSPGVNENMQSISSPRWQLDRSHLQNHSLEGLRNYVNVANSSDSETKRLMSGSFGQQQSKVPNNWKALESKIVVEHSMLKNQGRENHVPTMSSRSPVLGNSGSPGGPGEDSQQLPQHHGFDFWRPANSPMNLKGTQENRNAPAAESSVNNDMREKGHENNRNSGDAFHPNSANHTLAGAVRENACLDTGESSNLLKGLQNQSAVGFQKPAAFRKFQFHPMGNVDTGLESPYGIKQGAAKPMISQNWGYMDQRLHGNAKLVGNADGTTISSEKYQADPRGTESAIRGMMSYASDKLTGSAFPLTKNVQSSHNMLELLHKVDQAREHVTSPHLSSSERNDNNDAETSEGSVGHFQRNRIPTSKGFSLQLAPPSPRLQNFNCASPSRNSSATLPGSHPLSSKGVSTSIQSTSSLRETPSADLGNNIFSASGQTTNKIPIPNFQGNVSRAFTSGFPFATNQPPNKVDIGAHGVGPLQSTIGSSSQIHGQLNLVDTSHERVELNQSNLDAVPSIPSKPELAYANQTQRGMPQFPMSQSSVAVIVPEPAPLSRVLPDAWMGTSNQQHMLSAIPGNCTLGLVNTQPKYLNQVDMASSPMQKLGSGELHKVGHGPSEPNEPVKTQGFYRNDQTAKEPSLVTVLGKEYSMKPLSDASHSTSDRQGKAEAFDSYLSPSNSMGNYSLLHQVQAFKTDDVDRDDRAVKRLKGLHSSSESQSVSLAIEKIFAKTNLPGGLPDVRDVDSEMLHFSNRPGESLGVSGPSPDAVIVSRNDCPSNSLSNKIASVGCEISKISHQTTPPELEQYGGFINENVCRMDDARKMALLKSMQQPVIFHESAHSIQMQSSIGNLLNHSTPSVATSELTLSHVVLPSGASDSIFPLKSRKRKSVVPELPSWHIEVVEGFGRAQEISVAEIEWDKACNRLAVKIDNESEQIEDAVLLQRPRRRLLLTTQLMQLLIRPSSAAFLGGNAVINVENVVYSATRKTLGDACNFYSDCSHGVRKNDEKTNPETPEVPGESDDQRLTKAIEYLVGRTRTFTNELSRLDRRCSIADLRAECQDLEKFSIINRFAKFHGRGHAEVVGTPSSDAAASLLKFFPQRYVTALPMPRNLPDRTQCLSL